MNITNLHSIKSTLKMNKYIEVSKAPKIIKKSHNDLTRLPSKSEADFNFSNKIK